MSVLEALQQKLDTLPAKPGCYLYKDAAGKIIYVGKAKSLRSRLSSYFQDLSALHPRTQQMVTTAASVEWTVVGTEVEALALEDYETAIREARSRGVMGGGIYDSLHATFARRIKAAQIVTRNPSHFQHVAPDIEILTP